MEISKVPEASCGNCDARAGRWKVCSTLQPQPSLSRWRPRSAASPLLPRIEIFLSDRNANSPSGEVPPDLAIFTSPKPFGGLSQPLISLRLKPENAPEPRTVLAGESDLSPMLPDREHDGEKKSQQAP